MRIESCVSAEAICDFLGSDCHPWQEEVAVAAIDAACRYLDERGVEWRRAAPQRSTYHGWRGAHYTHRCGLFGVWGDAPQEVLAILWEASDIARRAGEEALDSLESVTE